MWIFPLVLFIKFISLLLSRFLVGVFKILWIFSLLMVKLWVKSIVMKSVAFILSQMLSLR